MCRVLTEPYPVRKAFISQCGLLKHAFETSISHTHTYMHYWYVSTHNPNVYQHLDLNKCKSRSVNAKVKLCRMSQKPINYVAQN